MPRHGYLQLRVSDAEMNDIEAEAARAGLTRAEYARLAALKSLPTDDPAERLGKLSEIPTGLWRLALDTEQVDQKCAFKGDPLYEQFDWLARCEALLQFALKNADVDDRHRERATALWRSMPGYLKDRVRRRCAAALALLEDKKD